MRARSIGLAAFALVIGLLPALAPAQSWPQKPVRVIVPFAAGGGTDFIARLASRQLSQRLGQQFVVENRAGANGIIGLQALKQSEPDGYTIAAASDGPLAINPALYEGKLPYDTLRDFVPVGLLVRFPGVILVHPSVPARSVGELLALARAKPNGLAYSSAGVGNFSHLALELLALQTGVKLLHVPYKGTGPAGAALVAGDVQLMFNNVQTALPHIRANQIVAIATGEPKRLAAFPDLPTVGETVPGYAIWPYVGVVAPAAVPKDVVARLSREIYAVMRDPEVVKQLEDQQTVPMPMETQEFTEHVRKDIERWAGVIRTAGIKGE